MILIEEIGNERNESGMLQSEYIIFPSIPYSISCVFFYYFLIRVWSSRYLLPLLPFSSFSRPAVHSICCMEILSFFGNGMANPDCLLHTALGIDIIATVKLNELGFRAPRYPIQHPLAPRRHQFHHTMGVTNQFRGLLDPVLMLRLFSSPRAEFSLTNIMARALQDNGILHKDEDLWVG